jgi:hypothetical protein
MARPRKNPKTVTKICEYCNNKFEANYYKRHIRRFCSKKCANACPDTKKKIINSQKKTFNEKYGTDHPMKTEQTKQNFKKSMKQKYGVEHALQHKKIFDKMKSTNMKKFGTEFFYDKNLIEKTCMEKYGCKNAMQNPEFQKKRISTFKNKLYNDVVKYCKNTNLTFLTKKADCKTRSFYHPYKFCCNDCNTTFFDNLYKLNSISCPVCFPIAQSSGEDSLYTFLSSIYNKKIIRRNRKILNGLEIDFYLPDINLAIEYNGSYWHSEKNGKNKIYHINKTNKCLSKSIKLIHVFEHEWIYKSKAVKIFLKNSIISKETQIENCKVSFINKKQKKEFLENYHIQGNDNSSIYCGVFINDTLISVMTFAKSKYKNFNFELSRFCDNGEFHSSVIYKMMFDLFTKKHKGKILHFSDRRYDASLQCIDMGFCFLENSKPKCFYTTNYKDFLHERMVPKQKMKSLLENYDPKLTNWENLKNNGFDRIWDCGTSKWIYAK